MNIFIDTEDMEERYAEELYKEYLENKNKELQKRINRAITYIKKESWYMYKDDEEVIDRTPTNKLLDILKGGSNEK